MVARFAVLVRVWLNSVGSVIVGLMNRDCAVGGGIDFDGAADGASLGVVLGDDGFGYLTFGKGVRE